MLFTSLLHCLRILLICSFHYLETHANDEKPSIHTIAPIAETTAVALPSNPVCVWNQAYIENYQEDKYKEIVANAIDCYVLIDPFHDNFQDNPASKIAAIQQSGGNTVGCYFSSGTCENWRSDYNSIKNFCVDKQWGDWEGEYFIYNTQNILPFMKARIDLMAKWGCNYIEFDNMDWCTDDEYRDDYGSEAGKEFPSVQDCAIYNMDLCEYTRNKSMLCMAKNSGYTEHSSQYAGGDIMDAVTFESYRSDFNWWSNSHLQGFINANKPVVIVHYNAGTNDKKNSCDFILKKYQNRYKSEKISFICESKKKKKYLHYDAPCPAGNTRFKLDLQTDNRASQTSWVLQMKKKGKYTIKKAEGKNYKNNTLYHRKKCIPSNKCFRFFMKDSAQNGLCCAHGDGYYRISLNGEVIKYSTYNNKKKKETKIFGTGGRSC